MLDFAISSGMQSELFHPVAQTPGLVFQRYNDLKRSFQGTARTCEAQGFMFTPVVFEAHGGGWSPLARASIDWISKQLSLALNEDPAAVSLQIAQRISCTLQRENARAVLRRSAAPKGSSFLPSGWEDPDS